LAAEPVPQSAQARILVAHPSKQNIFKVLKTYNVLAGTKRVHDPDRIIRFKPKKVQRQHDPQYGPFATKTAFELAEWYWGSAQKSFSDFEKLIRILGDPQFSIPNAVDVNWRAAFRVLGSNREDLSEEAGRWIQDDGWKTTPITIQVPFHKLQKNTGMHDYFAGNLRHRNILSVIKEKIANAEDSRQFHYQPYRSVWKPSPDSPEVELYGELYSSRAFRDANEEIQRLPSTQANEGLERVVVSLMFWSDGTKLTNFGGSTLWPCYMFFGNESKYRRCQPSELLGHQIAYFIKVWISTPMPRALPLMPVLQLSDTFKDFLKDLNGGRVPSDALFSHCVRELFQGQWAVLLDDELIDTMKNGIVLRCPDGEFRCFYPRVFTYSADYPERCVEVLPEASLCSYELIQPHRILIGGIWNNGGCPCHRCTIKSCDLSNLGAPTDTERRDQVRSEEDQWTKVAKAREVIESGYAVDTAQVEALLKPHSLVPTVVRGEGPRKIISLPSRG
jgi:hypothetical protein